MILRFDQQKRQFTHTFTLTNHGPSYTNVPKTVKLYLSKLNLTTHEVTDMNCTSKIENVNFEMPSKMSGEDNPIGCQKGLCQVFSCIIPRNWQKSEKRVVSVTTQFNSLEAKEMEQTIFSFYSMAKIDDEKENGIILCYNFLSY